MKQQKSSTAPKRPSALLLFVVFKTLKLVYFLFGVRMKSINKVGKPENPAIILCTHGSFIDFVFAADLVGKYRPNFVGARLYFYNNALRRMLRALGAFPKSMFTLDTASTKNCLRVLKSGGILGMMPEARLSTAGRFEDIQESTFSFIKKSAVPVYTVNFYGDYLADPKWGKGFRRGARVEAVLDILYTAEDVKRLSVEEIQQGVEQRLYYDEFAWLKERPNIRYRSRRMAEGIENILTLCPSCGEKHSLTAKKDKIFCEKCGYLTALDNRYAFDRDFRFENLSQWYDWQKAQLQKQIGEDPDYKLFSKVQLRLPSNGRGMTRPGGEGVCTLSRKGLNYQGTKDGQAVDITFPVEQIYRLLFGAGVNFEIYNGTEILFFVPEEKRSAVDWYMASMILYDERNQEVG